MKTAIVVGRNNQLPKGVADVLKRLQLEPKLVTISEERSHFRRDAKGAFMAAFSRLGIKLEEGMAIVRLSDDDVVLAQGARSAILHLTILDQAVPSKVDPIMISFSRGKVVAVKGDELYPIPA